MPDVGLRPTSPCSNLVLLSARRGRDKYTFLIWCFCTSKSQIPLPAKENLTWWPNGKSADFPCGRLGVRVQAYSNHGLSK